VVDELYQLKWEYNNNLNRYYNGCNYVTENSNQFDKYIDEIMKIKNNMERILEKIQSKENVTEAEILGGFQLC